jgi:hypothetical protein
MLARSNGAELLQRVCPGYLGTTDRRRHCPTNKKRARDPEKKEAKLN